MCNIETNIWTCLKSLRPSIELLGCSLMKSSSKLTLEEAQSWVRGWERDSVHTVLNRNFIYKRQHVMSKTILKINTTVIINQS